MTRQARPRPVSARPNRARTLRVLADPNSVAADLIRPGHVVPLRAVDGGVMQRPGHTEAAVDLLLLAGLRPVGVIAEVVAEDGEMMRLPGLLELGRQNGLPVISIGQVIQLASGSRSTAADSSSPLAARRTVRLQPSRRDGLG